MAQLLSGVVAYFIFLVAKCAFGEIVRGFVGDPVQFLVHEFCESAKLLRFEQSDTQPVSAREGGVCKPAEEYKDRLNLTSCLGFTRTLYTDAGLYELKCNGSKQRICLKVNYRDRMTFTEGDPGSLLCNFKTTTIGNHVNQTTPSPPLTTTQSDPGERKWTFVIVICVIVIVVLLGLVCWYLKTRRCPCHPPGPGGAQCTQANGEMDGNVPDEIGETQV